jgi:hypothetical protein
MRKLNPILITTYNEIDIPFDDIPTHEELVSMKEELKTYQKTWAENLLNELEAGKTLPTSYPYPVEMWQLGSQTIVSLGGELLVNYPIRLKSILGNDIIVMGYSNDLMGYIPGEEVLSEGRYEGESSRMVYGLPATWKTGIEEKIIGEVKNQVLVIKSSPLYKQLINKQK